ncbi:hypothetical protein [uncultured Croceitalea sp.]|uniref:hypothetical protein n=1 Tax=uncultured Croceitalea sp. TaxID=1798908 RepID=UPI003305A5C6
MKNSIVFIMVMLVLACKKTVPEQNPNTDMTETNTLVGTWDNFQQYWLENTDTDMHRVETNDKHRHLSLEISEDENGHLQAEIREGRNGKNLIETITLSDTILDENNFEMKGDTVFIKGMKHFENKDPYKFIRTRRFSGWIEMPMKQYPDSIYRKSNLEIHDQGGMAEIDLEGVRYTAELTQLLFGQKLAIMKLAIYDVPLDSVQINSRSISYTWTNPEAKRAGINLRKVTSGWTFIEPGFVNSDNTKFDKK